MNQEKNILIAKFDPPIQAATCGQSLVFYEDDMVVAGGIINYTK